MEIYEKNFDFNIFSFIRFSITILSNTLMLPISSLKQQLLTPQI